MSAVQITRISDLLPYILPKVPSCPLPYAEFMARLAVIEFCEKTRCWRQIIEATVAENNATLIAPQGSTIHEFEEVTLNGRELTPTQFTDVVSAEMQGPQPNAQANYISQIAPGQVAVYPFEPGVLRVSCFLKPRHGQAIGLDAAAPLDDAYNVLPSFMVAQYAESLAAGALARILETERSDFFNPELSQKYRGDFFAAIGSNFRSNVRGQQRAPLRVRPRWM